VLPLPVILSIRGERKMTIDKDTLEINEVSDEITNIKYDSRETLLNHLDEVIEYLHQKALKGRVVKPENEKVRIQWFKTLAYTCSIYNQIKRDVEIDQLDEKVDTLTKQIEELNMRSRV
jgi:hypothetical protein